MKIIAEIGWNHMGKTSLAEKMISEASKAGADYAKFQTWNESNLISGPWDKDGRREIYKKAQLTKNDHIKLYKICKKYNIKFLTSIFDISDYKLFSNLRLNTIKIPSPENRNNKLLKFCSKTFKNIFLSTGAAKLNEVRQSYNYIKKNNVSIMHCVSKYPCEDRYVNLSRINDLKKICKSIGLSDHTHNIDSSIFSFGYGVEVIEKHFTINNNLPGRDNKFAILPKDLKKLCDLRDKYLLMTKKNSKELTMSDYEIRNIYSGRWSGNGN